MVCLTTIAMQNSSSVGRQWNATTIIRLTLENDQESFGGVILLKGEWTDVSSVMCWNNTVFVLDFNSGLFGGKITITQPQPRIAWASSTYAASNTYHSGRRRVGCLSWVLFADAGWRTVYCKARFGCLPGWLVWSVEWRVWLWVASLLSSSRYFL